MKTVRIAALTLGVLWGGATSEAAISVWYNAVDSFGVTHTSGPGQTLDLLCAGSGPVTTCNWTVSMVAELGPGGIISWSSDLLIASGLGVSASDGRVSAGPFDSVPITGSTGTGANLLHGYGAQTFSPVPPQTLTLMTFTLTRVMTPSSPAVADIFGGPSASEVYVWTDFATADYIVVRFGPNEFATALPGAYGALPLIHIATPEPGSMGLLALGAMVVLRRRRRAVGIS